MTLASPAYFAVFKQGSVVTMERYMLTATSLGQCQFKFLPYLGLILHASH